ncbi:MAG: type II toxin-antitoxin system ParD family antitoxin [Hyphomicrobiales bacterium]|nr:MAG: type II toxin-antitoxin system ParD family antitoxin [Hyphomicrobiales bacterium]
MATLTISISDEMRGWIEEQVRSGRYPDANAVFADLIREDQARAEAIAELQALIDEGLASGISDRTPEDIRNDVLAELGLTRRHAS